MHRAHCRWVGLIVWAACLFTGMAQAAALAVVEAVQAPAWVERGGIVQPLAPDQEIANGDVVRIGNGARAYLLLAEGSRVKLGEGASLTLHSRSLEPKKSWHGVVDVVAGAFRYTTGALKRVAHSEVQIRVGTATIGIRGTDIWGKSSQERDIVALLSGRIEVTRGGETQELAEPLTYFDAPREGLPLVRPLESGQLAVWARETEILPGDGAARAGGRWRVRIATAQTQQEALTLYDRLRSAGFPARVGPVAGDEPGVWRYEVYLPGFPDRREADAAASRLAALTGLAAERR